jgi:hypothetical protein
MNMPMTLSAVSHSARAQVPFHSMLPRTRVCRIPEPREANSSSTARDRKLPRRTASFTREPKFVRRSQTTAPRATATYATENQSGCQNQCHGSYPKISSATARAIRIIVDLHHEVLPVNARRERQEIREAGRKKKESVRGRKI